jgi:hypothetical protein
MCLCGLGLQPGAALVVVRLAVVTLKTRSTAPAVAGCFLVGCSVVRGLPLRSRAVVGVSQPFCVGLVPVLASRAQSPSAASTGLRPGLCLAVDPPCRNVTIRHVVAGSRHVIVAYAVDHSLELYGWGDNAVRQLGLPTSQPGEPNTHHVLSPTRIPFDCQLL